MSGAALRAADSDFFPLDEAPSCGVCAKSADAKLRAMPSLPAVEIMMLSIDVPVVIWVCSGKLRRNNFGSSIIPWKTIRARDAGRRSGLGLHFLPLVPASVPALSFLDFLALLVFFLSSFFDSVCRAWAVSVR